MQPHIRESNHFRLFEMITAFWLPQAIFAVAKLGIPDLIGDQIVSVEELSKVTGAPAAHLYRLLRALASEGIFIEHESGKFSIGELGQLLRSGRADSMLNATKMYNTEIYQAWGNFVQVVMNGETCWPKLFDATYFDYLKLNPESNDTFNDAMKELALTVYSDQHIGNSYRPEQNATIVDVGGGKGGLISCLMEGRHDLKAILFDLPHVVPQARQALENLDNINNVKFVEGDFFDSVPRSGSLYILKRILHDWPDEQAISILRNCREAMSQTAALLIIEYIIPKRNEWSRAYFVDLHMMTILGGRERSELEFKNILIEAGFTKMRTIQTQGCLSVIEAS